MCNALRIAHASDVCSVLSCGRLVSESIRIGVETIRDGSVPKFSKIIRLVKLTKYTPHEWRGVCRRQAAFLKTQNSNNTIRCINQISKSFRQMKVNIKTLWFWFPPPHIMKQGCRQTQLLVGRGKWIDSFYYRLWFGQSIPLPRKCTLHEEGSHKLIIYNKISLSARHDVQ